MMADLDLLHGKRVLVVDDEPDILDTVVELLDMCQVTAAGTFEEARNLLGVDKFDIVVLDIMGVDGYSLLKTCTRLGIPTVMLTAHAFTPDNLIRSVEEGAMSYIPKEELPRLADFLNSVLQARREGRDPWDDWQEKLSTSYFERRWGAALRGKGPDFWNRFRAGLAARKSDK
jgi:DNA-binding response OmpR family regulator